MSFGWPIAFLALLIIPLAIAAYVVVQRRRPRYAVRFTNLDLLANVADKTPGWRRHVPAAMYLLALTALVFALARPERDEKIPREEATVILVTDVSGSMVATDVQPTRLGAAKVSAESLVDKLPPKFQVAVMSFATGVNTLVTPTTDRQQVIDAIERLQAKGGTAMGDAIAQAVELAAPPPIDAATTGAGTPNAAPTPTPTPAPGAGGTKAAPKTVIVLLSDGANTAGLVQPLDAAQIAADAGVPVFAIALGTQNGIAEVTDDRGRLRRVAVPPDEDTLRAVAETTNGKFFKAPTEQDLKAVYDELGSKIGYTTQKKEVGYLFAAAAGAFVLVAGGLSLAWFNRFP